MSDSWKDRDKKVKDLLDKIDKIDDGWDIMLNILERRAYRKMLVDRRKQLGMTQKALAEKLGISQASVAEFENEPYPDPYLSTLRRYAMALGLKVSHDVFPVEDYPEPSTVEPVTTQS